MTASTIEKPDPSLGQWVCDVVGRRYQGWDIKADVNRVWLCFKYDPQQGFWMRTCDELGPERETCVSERAIDRTFHTLPSCRVSDG